MIDGTTDDVPPLEIHGAERGQAGPVSQGELGVFRDHKNFCLIILNEKLSRLRAKSFFPDNMGYHFRKRPAIVKLSDAPRIAGSIG